MINGWWLILTLNYYNCLHFCFLVIDVNTDNEVVDLTKGYGPSFVDLTEDEDTALHINVGFNIYMCSNEPYKVQWDVVSGAVA